MYVIQQLINGLSQGSIYALMAIGYTLIVGVVGLITFAYGEMVMIGAMSAYLFYTYVTPNFFLGLLVAFISSSLSIRLPMSASSTRRKTSPCSAR